MFGKALEHNHMLRRIKLALAMVVTLSVSVLMVAPAAAAGNSFFTLNPASGTYAVGNTITLGVSVTSGPTENINGVQADFSYPDTILQYVSTTLTGPFTTCASNSGGSGTVSLACASSTAQTGTQQVANIVFKVLSTGTATVAMTNGTDIQDSSLTSVWNGVLPTASYTISGTATTTTTTSSPKTPNTGSALVSTHPWVTLAGAAAAAAGLYALFTSIRTRRQSSSTTR